MILITNINAYDENNSAISLKHFKDISRQVENVKELLRHKHWLAWLFKRCVNANVSLLYTTKEIEPKDKPLVILDKITHKTIESYGMELEQWNFKSCTAEIGVGENWATVYLIESKDKRKGHAAELLAFVKAYYEKRNKVFGSSVALNPNSKNLLLKLNIKEY